MILSSESFEAVALSGDGEPQRSEDNAVNSKSSVFSIL
jgi:hypothetical protein